MSKKKCKDCARYGMKSCPNPFMTSPYDSCNAWEDNNKDKRITTLTREQKVRLRIDPQVFPIALAKYIEEEL